MATVLAIVLSLSGSAVVAVGGPSPPQSGYVAIASVVLAADGRTLRVAYLAGASGHGCGDPAGVAVTFATNTTVALLATVSYDLRGEAARACPLAARQAVATVELADPLGDRLLVDAQRGEPIRVFTAGPSGSI